MPGIIIHTLLGTQLLDRWRDSPALAPFPAGDPALRATFLAGCMGPDMGMYPGGKPLFSDLAHYVRTGELVRALLRESRSDAERAFAWGWASHVLADVIIHPLINIAAGDLRGCGPLTYDDDAWSHLSVEVGADGCWFARWRELGIPALPPVPAGVVESVARAYRAVYGPTIGTPAVRGSLSGWARWHRFSIALAGAASAKLYGRAGGRHGFQGFARRVAKLGTGVFAWGSRVHGLTHPLAPSARAEGLIENALVEYPERFRELERDGLESLPDYNLDTGTVEQPVAYPPTVKTLARLRRENAGATRC